MVSYRTVPQEEPTLLLVGAADEVVESDKVTTTTVDPTGPAAAISPGRCFIKALQGALTLALVSCFWLPESSRHDHLFPAELGPTWCFCATGVAIGLAGPGRYRPTHRTEAADYNAGYRPERQGQDEAIRWLWLILGSVAFFSGFLFECALLSMGGPLENLNLT